MSYIHQGKVLPDGEVDTGAEVTDPLELTVLPEDDALHIKDYRKGDFEWWYFDLLDEHASCFLKIVMHIGTDPLRTKVYPQLALSINTPEFSESVTIPYTLDDIKADTSKCQVSAGREVRIYIENQQPLTYKVEVGSQDFTCNLKWISETEGWKPLGSEIPNNIGRKKSLFSWVIPVPKATVEGHFSYKGRRYEIADAIGYHDHNYYKVSGKKPLYLDQLINKWYWGKAYCGDYTFVFMDTFSRLSRISSFLIMKNNKIVHSSNNQIESKAVSFANDDKLNTLYPQALEIDFFTEDWPVKIRFEFDKLLDNKDLIAEVNPVLRWLIKKTIARPAYHGVLAKVNLFLEDKKIEGIGNFESMIFR